MSGPNPPGREPDEPESEPVSDTGDERASGNHLPPVAGGGDKLPSDQTGETDAYSRAYSAPESEHVTGGPYVPADLRLYDYDDYEESSDLDDELAAPRWPWVVGVAAIIAAVALVVSVSLLVTRPHTSKLATGDHRDPDSDGDTDGHCDAATTAPTGDNHGAAAGDHHNGGGTAAHDHHADRSAASHLFGDRYQGAG